MKIPVDGNAKQAAVGLQQLFWKRQTGAAAKPVAKKDEQSFENELQQEKARDEKDAASSSSKRTASPAARTSPLEALLVSHATNPRPAVLIDTKKQNVKAAPAPKAETEAVAVRAKALPTHAMPAATKELATRPRDAKQTHGDARSGSEKKDEFKLESAKPAAAPTTIENKSIEAPQPMVSANPIREAAPLAPVAPLMLEDASLRAVLLPTVARVSLEAGDAGRLNVQLKVNDGVTEIRATGPAAQLLESRQGELRVALAKEGLALGHFDLTQGQGHQTQHQRDEDGGAPLTRKTVASSTDDSSRGVVRTDGGLHVKA